MITQLQLAYKTRLPATMPGIDLKNIYTENGTTTVMQLLEIVMRALIGIVGATLSRLDELRESVETQL